MKKEEIFKLYKRVQLKDKDAEDTLILIYKEKYPLSTLHETAVRGSCSYSRKTLHTMYLHLYR